MPRLARLPSIAFGWYYVVLRAVADARIVTRREELATLLKILRATLRERGARLHAAYIAEGQVHLALQLGEGALRALTGRFQHEYARIFNRTHQRHGSLFRWHHHVLLIQHERWLVPLVHYIHWIRRLETPADGPEGLWWSSDSVYRGTERREWLTTNVVLRMLARGAYSRKAQESAYRELLEREPPPRHARLFRQGCPEDPRLLGDAEFVRRVWRITGRRSPDRSPRVRQPEGDIPGIVRQVIERFNALCDERLPPREAAALRRLVTDENVRSKSRRRPLPMVRALCVSYLVEGEMATATQAARFFGCGPRPVSARRRRFYALLFRDWFGASSEALLWSAGDVDRVVDGGDQGPKAGGRIAVARMP
jgi:hypothetical protein